MRDKSHGNWPTESDLEMSTYSVRPWREIKRRKSRTIRVGQVAVGGDSPISVQTMTNTLTTDVSSTVAQIQRCAEAGADIVRVSVPDPESSNALREIVAESPVPIVADIHFHYRRAIESAESGAACLRINPGNIGSDERISEVVRAAFRQWMLDQDWRQCGQSGKAFCSTNTADPARRRCFESALRHYSNLGGTAISVRFKVSCKAVRRFPCRRGL